MKKILLSVLFIPGFLLSHHLVWADDNELRINNPETLIYEITDKDNNVSVAACKYKIQMQYGKKMFSYIYTNNNETWKVLTDTKANPLSILYIKGDNKMTLLFNNPKEVFLKGYWDGKEINKTCRFSTPVTLENMLKVSCRA